MVLNSTIEDNFIKLYISGVTNLKIDFTLNDDEINQIINLAKSHSLETVIYQAFKINDIKIPAKLEKEYQFLLFKMFTQDAELESLSCAFTNHKIYHLPLKGSVLRKYYPNPILRIMADLDILFHEEDLKQAGMIVKELGYEVEHLGGNHDVYYKKPYMNIELHRALISSSYELLYNYYIDIWNRLDTSNYLVRMNKEDFLIYLILHAGKHFATSGAGLRFLMDLHFFFLKEKDIDMRYVMDELKKTNFDTFAEIVITISKKLFDDLYHDDFNLNDDERYVLSYLISSGTYGTYDNSAAIGVSKENNENIKSNKIKYFFKRVFPSYKTMVSIYPKLKRRKLLLPIYYLMRICRVIFKSKSYKQQLNSINNVQEEDLERIKRIKEITKVRSISDE